MPVAEPACTHARIGKQPFRVAVLLRHERILDGAVRIGLALGCLERHARRRGLEERRLGASVDRSARSAIR